MRRENEPWQADIMLNFTELVATNNTKQRHTEAGVQSYKQLYIENDNPGEMNHFRLDCCKCNRLIFLWFFQLL